MRVQVSIDTAVQHCEVWNLVAGTSPTLWSLVRWALVVGRLVGIIHSVLAFLLGPVVVFMFAFVL